MREKILNFIKEFQGKNGYIPSYREICVGVGVNSTSSVAYHIKKLKESGELVSEGNKKRCFAFKAKKDKLTDALVGTLMTRIDKLECKLNFLISALEWNIAIFSNCCDTERKVHKWFRDGFERYEDICKQIDVSYDKWLKQFVGDDDGSSEL